MARTKRLRPDLWATYLRDRLAALDRPAQWCAWQVEHPQHWERPKPKGWKGWR
jgi:tRNA (guanine37-N1)-methyltransferase